MKRVAVPAFVGTPGVGERLGSGDPRSTRASIPGTDRGTALGTAPGTRARAVGHRRPEGSLGPSAAEVMSVETETTPSTPRHSCSTTGTRLSF